jgi:hypothetical protein
MFLVANKSSFAEATADKLITGPSTALRAILPAIEAGKIGFVWVRFDQVSNLHFSL